MKKLFIVRKYVFAENITQALKKKPELTEVWVEDDWKKANMFERPKKDIGFKKTTT